MSLRKSDENNLGVKDVRMIIKYVGATQVRCKKEEKISFWNVLDNMLKTLPIGEIIVIGADINRFKIKVH